MPLKSGAQWGHGPSSASVQSQASFLPRGEKQRLGSAPCQDTNSVDSSKRGSSTKRKKRKRRDSWPPSRITESVSGIFVNLNNNNNNNNKNNDPVGLEEVFDARADSISIMGCDESGLITLKEDDFNLAQAPQKKDFKGNSKATSTPVRVNPQETLLRLIQHRHSAGVGSPNSSGQHLMRKRKIASIFQHYYPEGDWGYVILAVGLIVQILAHGLQLGFGVVMTVMPKRWIRREHFVENSGKLNMPTLLLLLPGISELFARIKRDRHSLFCVHNASTQHSLVIALQKGTYFNKKVSFFPSRSEMNSIWSDRAKNRFPCYAQSLD